MSQGQQLSGGTGIPPMLNIELFSWGIKRVGLTEYKKKFFSHLPVADLYLDCRGIREHGKGIDRNNFEKFSAQIQQNNKATLDAMVAQIVDSITALPSRRYGKPGGPYAEPYRICFFCAWGMNRSPTTKFVVARRLHKLGYKLSIDDDKWYEDILAEDEAAAKQTGESQAEGSQNSGVDNK